MNLAELENNQDLSWRKLSEGWPETPYTKAKWLLCTQRNVIPYGEYVVVGNTYTFPKKQPDGSYYDYTDARIRCSTIEYRQKLEDAAKEQGLEKE